MHLLLTSKLDCDHYVQVLVSFTEMGNNLTRTVALKEGMFQHAEDDETQRFSNS